MRWFFLKLFGKVKICPITKIEMDIKYMIPRYWFIGSGVNLLISKTYYSPEGFKIRAKQDKKYKW